MKSRLTLIVLLCFIGLINANVVRADQPIDSVQQSLWQQQDFVRAYYVVAEPGGALYSIFGHACLHLVCPAYDLDYFFSYESEEASKKVLTFLSGNLQMGMAAVDPETYLSGFEKDGRCVVEYELNLPIDKKRELWRVLDEKLAEGMNLPYDFEARGCAYSCSVLLNEALGDTKIEYAPWSPRFERTRREMCNDFGKYNYPWNMMFIMALVGTEVDKPLTPEQKLIIPTELAEVWQLAKVDGEYLLSRDAHVLLPSTCKHSASWFTPMVAALLLLALALLSWFVKVPYIDWLILAVVTLIGAVITYLVAFSSLPCTSWNWLIIPFNILPAIAWKWRKYWSFPYAGVIVIWIAGMLISTHQLVDPSMIVLSMAFIATMLKRNNQNIQTI